MKKTLYLFVGLMFTIKGYNQAYQPIPTDSVWWVEELEAYNGDPCLHHYYRYIYSTPNTVLIGGNNYHEFSYNEFIEHTPIGLPPVGGCPASSSYTNLLYALIRNDSTNKKVYIYDTNDTHQEILLYDYDLALGDTVNPLNTPGASFGFFYCTSDTFTVTNIDSVALFGSAYRKRYEISSPMHTSYLIEGIGSNLGFAQKIYCPFEQTTKLHCYHYKNLSYTTFNNGHCSQTLAIDDQITHTQQFIYRMGETEFTINNPEHADLRITCYDMLGKQLWNQHFTETGYLNFADTPAGVYIMYVEVNGQSAQPYKFVIGH